MFSFPAHSPQASSRPSLLSLTQRWFVAETKKSRVRLPGFNIPKADAQNRTSGVYAGGRRTKKNWGKKQSELEKAKVGAALSQNREKYPGVGTEGGKNENERVRDTG